MKMADALRLSALKGRHPPLNTGNEPPGEYAEDASATGMTEGHGAR
jgi:hypothetical protein